MLECKICGCKFNAVIEKHCISRDNGKTGLATIVSDNEESLYDTFDCPQCGCQHIAQERKRRTFPLTDGDDAEDSNDTETEPIVDAET